MYRYSRGSFMLKIEFNIIFNGIFNDVFDPGFTRKDCGVGPGSTRTDSTLVYESSDSAN